MPHTAPLTLGSPWAYTIIEERQAEEAADAEAADAISRERSGITVQTELQKRQRDLELREAELALREAQLEQRIAAARGP